MANDQDGSINRFNQLIDRRVGCAGTARIQSTERNNQLPIREFRDFFSY